MKSSTFHAFLAGVLMFNFEVQATEKDALWQEPYTGMSFVAVPGGCYNMGNPKAMDVDRSDFQLLELGYRGPRYADEAPVHEVCVDGFLLGRHEVTAEQWERVMGASPPLGRGQQPAAGISWRQAQAFISAFKQQSIASGRFRLPTEAEWEHACRLGVPAGAAERRETFGSIAWYSLRGQRLAEPSEVGQRLPDALGLYDMLGNVWEWTADRYSSESYLHHSRENPVMTGDGDLRVIRGASYRSVWQDVRCNSRGSYSEKGGLGVIGLRLVHEVAES